MSSRGANMGIHGWFSSCNRKKSNSFNYFQLLSYLFFFHNYRYKLMMVLFPFIVVLMNYILFLKRIDFYSHNVLKTNNTKKIL